MNRCIIDSDLLFPSLCCTDSLSAGEGISHICPHSLLDSGCSSGLSFPTSSMALWASFSTVKTKRSKCDSRISNENFLSFWQGTLFNSTTFSFCSLFAQPSSSSNDFFFLIWLNTLNKALEPGTHGFAFWLPLDLAIWHWLIHLHFVLVPFRSSASS